MLQFDQDNNNCYQKIKLKNKKKKQIMIFSKLKFYLILFPVTAFIIIIMGILLQISSQINKNKNFVNESSENELKLIDKVISECQTNKITYNKVMTWIFSNNFQKISNYFEFLLKKKDEKFHANNLIKRLIKNLLKYPKKILNEKREIVKNCLSSIYGAFLGDAIGAYCEFKQPSFSNSDNIFQGKTVHNQEKGQITDDSEMAISMAYGIMENPNLNIISSSYNYFYYGLWYRSNPFDIGITTSNALKYINDYQIYEFEEDFFNSQILKKIEGSNSSSKSNGFLMRMTPFIVWYFYRNQDMIKNCFLKKEQNILKNLYQDIKNLIKKDIQCTHTNQELPSASSLYIIIGLAALSKYNNNEIISILNILLENEIFDLNSNYSDENDVTVGKITKKALKEFSEENFDHIKYFTSTSSVYVKMGYYIHAFRLTLYYLINLDKYSGEKQFTTYRKIMNEICNFGGDTDTNAAIVGGIIGILIGYDNFGNEDFNLLINKIVPERIVFSSSIMYIFIEFLEKTKKYEKGMEKFTILKELLKLMLIENPK